MPEWIIQYLQMLEQSPMGQTVRGVAWIYPVLESLHVIGIALLFGTTVVVDLRLMGLWRKSVSMTRLARVLLPAAHVGFVLAAITGLTMFSGIALSVSRSDAFLWKFGLIAVALANVAVFHGGIYRSVSTWNLGQTPISARFAGAISMASWSGTVFAGRFLAYV